MGQREDKYRTGVSLLLGWLLPSGVHVGCLSGLLCLVWFGFAFFGSSSSSLGVLHGAEKDLYEELPLPIVGEKMGWRFNFYFTFHIFERVGKPIDALI